MTMTLVRVPLTLAAALAFHVCMSPPTSPAPSTYSGKPGDRRAVCATARVIAAMLTKGLFWASAVTDTLVLLAPYVPASLPTALPSPGTLLAWLKPTAWVSLSSACLQPMPLATIAGTSLVVAGALLRQAAFRTLGQFYACPNPDPGCKHAHALMTTGPYAVVRHPGYAGLLLCTAGLGVLQLDMIGVGLGLRGSVGEGVGPVRVVSALAGTGTGVIRTGASVGMRMVALACAQLGTVSAIRRIRNEERALRARFKGEWEAWAERVRYKLVPGVY